jgi:signal transduction histidine kinase
VEQTVDRASSLGPTYASAAQLVRTNSAHEMSLSLLPVRSARELAAGLARHWQNWSGAETTVIAFGIGQVGRKFVARTCSDTLPQVTESAFDSKQANAGFEEFAKLACGAPVRNDVSIATIPFPMCRDAIGGVLLYSSEPSGLHDVCDEWTLWSGRLLDQAAIVEQRLEGRGVVESAKIEAIAEFAGGAGHEINNPLATIAGRVQILLGNEPDSNRRQDLATIGAQALRVRDMIGDLMLFARPPALSPQRLLLNEIAQAVIDQFADTARSRSCSLELEETGPIFATADPTQLRIVLSELIRNSLYASESVGDSVRGEIIVRLGRDGLPAKSAAFVSVTDNGPGLTERDRAHLFDPFYSGRDAGRGLGFGLCKCWRIVSRHGGWIEFDSVPGIATSFRIIWPDELVASSHELREHPFSCP